MRYSDAMSALAEARRSNQPVSPDTWSLAGSLSAVELAAPTILTQSFLDETVTLAGPVAPSSARYASRTRLSIDGDRAALWAEKDLLCALLEVSGHVEDPARYPADTRALIADHLAHPLMKALATALEAETVEILDHIQVTGEAPADPCFAMTIAVSGGAATRLVLSAPEHLLTRITDLLSPSQRTESVPTPRIDTSGIEFACSLFAPDFEFAGEDLATLQENDVMVLEARWLEADSFSLRVADTLEAAVARIGDAIHLRSQLDPIRRNDTMERDSGSVSTLPVTVCIELARKTLTLEELQGVGVGDIVDFANASLDTVRLSANGRQVGEGVLVRSGDQVGIRITSVA